MRRFFIARSLIVLQGFVLTLPTAAAWTLTGSNTLRVETYQVEGDERNSPYAEEGTFVSNDLDFSLFGKTSPGQEWRFDFAGTITDSPYRSAYSGLSPEVMRLSYDNSTVALPYRIDLGDQNVNLSELTLNRTLKAGRVTLKPNSGIDGRQYWASAVAGSDGQQWRDFDPQADLYRGVSVGMEDQRLGRYSANVVHHSHDALSGLPSASQWAASLTAQRKIDIAGQDLNVSSELAYSKSELATNSSKDGHGYFIQLDGSSQLRPLDYRLRYDRYSRGFRPNGSAAVTDSEAMLAEAGWRFEQGGHVRGRLQRTRTELSSGNPVRTDSAGINVSGGLLPGDSQRLIGRLDLSLQKRASAKGDIDLISKTARGGVDFTHNKRHQTRLDASVVTVDDLNRPGTERVTRQVVAGHTARFMLRGVDVTVSPGVSVTEVETQDSETTAGPVLSVSAARDRERLVVELSQSEIDAADASADVEQTRFSIKYEIQRGQHSVGVDMDHTSRDPAAGEDTDSWRAGMYWRYNFTKELG